MRAMRWRTLRPPDAVLLGSASGGQIKKPGDDLLSHPQRAVPSARQGLTSVFGMGTGGSPALWSPGNIL